MKVYTYSEARQRLADVLNIARTEEVVIKRRGGETFSIIFRKSPKSPYPTHCLQDVFSSFMNEYPSNA